MALHTSLSSAKNVIAATKAEAGIVTSQAIIMSFATCHRTILNLEAAPAPITEDEITCVVEMG